MLDKDSSTYEDVRVDRDVDPRRPTMLHLAAERNFLHVSRTLVSHCHGLLYLKTKKLGEEGPRLPVELALVKKNDDVAAYLITQMDNEWLVDHLLPVCNVHDF